MPRRGRGGGDSSTTGIGPGRWGYGAIGESGRAWVTRWAAGGSERKRGSGGIRALTGGAGQHSAGAWFSPV
jgi:hypothetical protein